MNNKLKLLAVVITALQLSACKLLPALSSSTNANFDKQTQDEETLEIKAIVEEWKVMKPALINLISLESDLQYVLTNIERSEERLQNADELQSAIKAEDEKAAYETIQLSKAENIVETFSEQLAETEKLSKLTVFADETLLEELNTAMESQSEEPMLFDEESEELTLLEEAKSTEPAELALLSESHVDAAASFIDHSMNSNAEQQQETEIMLGSAPPLAEYMHEKEDDSPDSLEQGHKQPYQQHQSELSPSNKFSSSPELNSNTISAGAEGKMASSAFTSAPDESKVVQYIDAKFQTAEPENVMNLKNSQTQSDASFAGSSSNQLDKFRQLGQGKMHDPKNIVASVSKPFSSDISSSDNKFRNAALPSSFKASTPDTARVSVSSDTSTTCAPSSEQIGNGYALHLASYTSLDNANKGWQNLTKAFSKELCGLTAITEKVTVNNKQYYSLRAGAFASKSLADSMCAKLGQMQQYCRSTPFTGQKLQ